MKIILLSLLENIGIGDKTKNNGILFLVSTGDREVRIEVGMGLEGKITDGKAGRILDDYVIPYFSDDDWNNGIRNGFNAILKEVCDEYDIKIDSAESAKQVEEDKQGFTVPIVAFITIFFGIFVNSKLNKILFGTVISLLAGIAEAYVAGDISFLLVYFIYNWIIMLIILAFSSGKGGGGGYYHGGGSYHSSSSGGSHGGGGHFSGGRS